MRQVIKDCFGKMPRMLPDLARLRAVLPPGADCQLENSVGSWFYSLGFTIYTWISFNIDFSDYFVDICLLSVCVWVWTIDLL